MSGAHLVTRQQLVELFGADHADTIEAAATAPVVPCDWCGLRPTTGKPLRPVPGERIGNRQLKVCSSCATLKLVKR